MTMDHRPPDTPPPSRPDPGDDQEQLVLWLLGELSPEEAERVAHAWRDRPREVERWKRFLGTTERIGSNIREETARASSREHDATRTPVPSKRFSTGLPFRLPSRPSSSEARHPASEGGLASLRLLLSVPVPLRIVPLAILTPVVIVFLLWLTRVSLLPVSEVAATVGVLSPMVQVLDQGVAQPSGPVGIGAKIRLRGETAAAKLSWHGETNQAVISGNAVLLVAEADLGLIQQEGRLTYDVVARQRPLRVWTSQGTIEIAEARVLLSGASSYLHYEVLDGSVRLSATGDTLAAGTTGFWGHRPVFEGNDPLLLAALEEHQRHANATRAPEADSDERSPGDSIATAPTTASDKGDTPSAVREANRGLASAHAVAPPAPRVRGRVIRPDYAPVEGARLTLNWTGGSGGETRGRDTWTTVTAADGMFAFRDVPDAASVWLRIEHPRLVPEVPGREIALDGGEERVVLFSPSSIAGRLLSPDGGPYRGEARVETRRTVFREGETVTRPLRSPDNTRVTAETESGLFLVSGLRPGSYRLHVEAADGQTGASDVIEVGLEDWLTGVEIALMPGGRFSGRVVDGESLQAIAGAKIELLDAGCEKDRGRDKSWPRAAAPESPEDAEGRFKGQAVSDENGNFFFHGIPPGSYEIRAAAEEYEENRLLVRIEVGKTREEVISLFGDATVVHGRVVDRSGMPIAGARISAGQSSERLYGEKQTASGEDGRYELRLPPGRWSLRAQAPGDRASWARETVEIERPSRIERNFVLFPGVRVFGTVTRAGQPLRGARLYFAAARSRDGVESTHTNDSGQYETVLRPGRYGVFVTGQQRASLDLGDTAEHRQDIAVADNRVSGTVLDAETGEAVAGARVILEGIVDDAPPAADLASVVDFFRRSRFRRSDAAGHFEFSDVEPGVYRLRASAEAYAENSIEPLHIPEGDMAFPTVTIPLDWATGLLEIHFTDAETGAALSGAAVWRVVSLETGEDLLVEARPRVSEASGFVLVTNLAPGTYSFTFIREFGDGHYLPVSIPSATVVSSETTRLEVPFRRGGAIRVSTKQSSARDPSILVPVSNATVRIVPPDDVAARHLRVSETTGPDGTTLFAPLPPGTYSVEASAPGFRTQRRSLRVAAGKALEVEFVLDAVPGPGTAE